ncbi:MAG: tetratricopeptide repeat protein [Rhodospirillaceae bacterium]
MRATVLCALLALCGCRSGAPEAPELGGEGAAINMVRALRLAGDCNAAAPVLARLQKETPVDLEVMLETAKCELAGGRFARAAEVLGAAVKIHPSSSEAETVLGVTLDHLERSAEARVHHDRAVALAPGSAMALSNKSISLALAGDLDEALALMRKAAALRDAPRRVRLNLALLEAVAGNGEVARALAQQEADPETIGLLQRIAEAAKR